MTRKSIRWRLTVWYSLALAAGLSLFALATWFSMWRSLTSDVDARLGRGIGNLEKFVNAEIAQPGVELREELEEYAQGLPAGTSLELKDDHGGVIFASPRANGSSYRTRVESIHVQGRLWRVEVSESLEPVESILRRLRFLLLMLVPVVISIASFGGLWLSRRALQPVAEITAAAHSIGIANLSERLTVPETGDELQQLSETWNGMLSRLEDAVKRLSRFTADASHELRTPLAVIRTTAEIAVRRSRSEAEYREALTQIIAEAERMTRLVEDLLFLARCDSESLEMPMSTVSLAPVVERVCSQIRPLADSKQIRFDSRLPDNNAIVLGNELAIQRLLLVLLDNAIKYSPEGGAVNVSLRERQDAFHLEISDSGPGIAETELPYIFERFYRAPEARSSAQAGAGLGLSLAAGIAQHHHAKIEVQSVPGKGSTFRVLFQPKAC